MKVQWVDEKTTWLTLFAQAEQETIFIILFQKSNNKEFNVRFLSLFKGPHHQHYYYYCYFVAKSIPFTRIVNRILDGEIYNIFSINNLKFSFHACIFSLSHFLCVSICCKCCMINSLLHRKKAKSKSLPITKDRAKSQFNHWLCHWVSLRGEERVTFLSFKASFLYFILRLSDDVFFVVANMFLRTKRGQGLIGNFLHRVQG